MAKQEAGKRLPKDWKDKFLAELAQTSNVSAAARKAGVETTAVYKTRRSDAEFYRHWQEALAEGYDNLEMDLLRRLRIGELTGGGPAKSRRKYDNAGAVRSCDWFVRCAVGALDDIGARIAAQFR